MLEPGEPVIFGRESAGQSVREPHRAELPVSPAMHLGTPRSDDLDQPSYFSNFIRERVILVQMSVRPFVWKMLCLVGISLLAGCGSGGPGKPVAIEGTVTLDGQPLANTQLQFVASEGLPANLRSHVATTNADGKYSLPKVYPATYAVSIVEAAAAPPDPAGGPVVVVVNNNPKANKLAKWSGGNSELRAEVSAEKKTFDFELKSSPAPRK